MRRPAESPTLPPPGAATSRKVGHYAICTIAGLVLTCYEWSLEIVTEFVDGTGHGDVWDVPVPLKYRWTARARGYFDTANNPYMHLYNGQASGTPPPDITAIAFAAYSDDVGSGTTNRVFAANGLVTRASWQVPDGMLEQEVEIRGTGVPTAIV